MRVIFARQVQQGKGPAGANSRPPPKRDGSAAERPPHIERRGDPYR